MWILAMQMMVLSAPLAAESLNVPAAGTPSPGNSESAIYIKYDDLKWDKLIPELGDKSAEISIIHVNPKTGATQLMIRCPKNYHAPKHWHTANETHYDVYGHFIMRDQEGRVADLSPGSFNYMPSKMVHEGWSKAEEGNLLFITVDGPWDINFIDGTPTPQQVHDMSQRPVVPAAKSQAPSSKTDWGL